MVKALIKYFICLAVPVLILNACSGSQNDGSLEKIPIKEIKQKVNENSSRIETLEASGNISFDSPEQSGSGWLELKIKKPDTVYVKIEGPFGISIANALITRTDFTYYNVQDNKVITGPSTDINIGAILRIKVTFDELINGFTGGFNLPDGFNDSTGAESENNMYIIRNGMQKFLIEPNRFTVQKYNSFDGESKTIVEVNYSAYSEESTGSSSVNLPTSLKIKNPSKSQTVYVDYINKEINKKDLSFKMKIPKSAKVIKWE